MPQDEHLNEEQTTAEAAERTDESNAPPGDGAGSGGCPRSHLTSLPSGERPEQAAPREPDGPVERP